MILTSLHRIHIESSHLGCHLVHRDMDDGTHNKPLKNFDCIYFYHCLPFCWRPICIEWPIFLMCHNHNENFALYTIQPNHDHHDICNCMPNRRQLVCLAFPSNRVHMLNTHRVLAVWCIPEKSTERITHWFLWSLNRSSIRYAIPTKEKNYLRICAKVFIRSA